MTQSLSHQNLEDLTMTVKVSKPSHQQQSRVFRYEQLVCLRSLLKSRNKEFILDSGKMKFQSHVVSITSHPAVSLSPHNVISHIKNELFCFIPICFNLIKNSFICPTNRNMSVSQQDGNITINNHNRKTWTISWNVKNQMAELTNVSHSHTLADGSLSGLFNKRAAVIMCDGGDLYSHSINVSVLKSRHQQADPL